MTDAPTIDFSSTEGSVSAQESHDGAPSVDFAALERDSGDALPPNKKTGLLTNIGLALISLHLVGVMWGSIQHKENLVRAMITGNKVQSLIAGQDSETN